MKPEQRDPDITRGISEVFGVMLILAITIIVAGIIAAFAGGFSFDSSEEALSANIVVSGFVVKSDHGHNYAYIIFDHMSGDPVNLNGVEFALGSRSSSTKRTVISNRLEPTGWNETGSSLTQYIQGYGAGSVTRIGTGDRLVLYADGWTDEDEDGVVTWQSHGSSGEFSVKFNDHLTYQIIDTRSKRVLSSGMIAVPEPS
jgi:flagellin-like protein